MTGGGSTDNAGLGPWNEPALAVTAWTDGVRGRARPNPTRFLLSMGTAALV